MWSIKRSPLQPSRIVSHADPTSPEHGGPPPAKISGEIAIEKPRHQTFWLWVMCLTGVDYFSTLAYQPSIAFEAAGLLAPLTTVVLVAVTLFGALPVYAHVASCSPNGQGSIAVLERLMHGWTGKAIVLALLGFAATDFVITKTLSAADAAVHLMDNPIWQNVPPIIREMTETQQRNWLTMTLLVILGATFIRGFKEAIGLAVVIVGGYLILNVLVIGSGLRHLFANPHYLHDWYTNVVAGHWHLEHAPLAGTGGWSILAISLLLFPKLALGLSGFETGVAVMPLIIGDPSDTADNPRGRIRNTRKLLITAAVIMSIYLLCSSLVTATLIPPEALHKDGPAADRALAYLAHGEGPAVLNSLFGETFGTIYDLSTVLILSFAGLSAMAGLLNLVPQYLPRYGMAPEWSRVVFPLVVLFTAINLFVTWMFDADVGAQGGAYATGVLVLISSACLATVIDLYRQRSGHWLTRTPWIFVFITLVFFFTTGANMIERPDGIKIASWFIIAVVISSFASRVKRSTELRFKAFDFANSESRFLWDSLKHLEFPVLVPHRPGRRGLDEKEASIRRRHRLPDDMPMVFIEAELGDASEFQHSPLMEVIDHDGRFVISVTRCASIAHAVATIALELSRVGKPPEIHFGWSDDNQLAASIGFFLFGEGNVPWLVRDLIRKAEPNPKLHPKVIIG
ncbi:MAG TPA: hypothetical protein VGG64_15315 [Pirellulales bacterium]|jgi:hypothetical protein